MDAPSFFAMMGLSSVSLVLLLVLALLFSSYVKIVTVLSVLRLGLGFDGLASVLLGGGLALALTFFVMYPTLEQSSTAASRVLQQQGSTSNPLTQARAIEAGLIHWKGFLQKHTHAEEKKRFLDIASRLDSDMQSKATLTQKVSEPSETSWRVLAPAFLVSELKEAFATGLSLFLPFLVVDLVVAHLLLAIGLERSDPAIVSFPFKLLLFVLVDGWGLITSNLVATYA